MSKGTPSNSGSTSAAPAVEPRVLLADDEPVARFAARRFLEKAGYAVDEVADGSAAVKVAAERGPYRLILLDCQMPSVDGPEAAREIRAAEAKAGAARVPIVALTAHESADAEERCVEAGMDGCLTKPIDRATFDELMNRVAPAGRPVANPAARSRRAVASTPPQAPAPAVPATPPEPLPTDPSAPFDVNAVLARARNDVGFVAQLLERFHARAAERLEQLVKCVDAGSPDAVAEEVHGLLGAARHLSAEGLITACHTMELAARAGDLRSARAFVAGIRSELDRCLKYVPGVVQTLRSRQAAQPDAA